MKEEITDLLSPEAFDDREYLYKGRIFKYANGVTLKVTRVDRKNKRAWAEHVTLVNNNKAVSHYGHIVDTTQDPPFCEDCDTPVDVMANNEGHKKAQDREDRTLPDGTIIE